MTNTKFSIIVPVYNVEKYLPECLDSILEQSFPDYEIILVDDGSKDGSPEICDAYQTKDSRVRVIHKENGGLVSARKAGAEIAVGEYILNVDSDDYIVPGLLEKLFNAVTQSGADIIAFDHMLVSEEGKKIGSYVNPLDPGIYKAEQLEQMKERLLYDFYLPYSNYGCLAPSIWSKAIKRKLFQENQRQVPEEIRMGEDLAVTIPCIYEATAVHKIRYEGYCYRQREGSIVHTFDPKEIGRIKLLVEYMKACVPQIPEKNMAGYIINIVVNYISKAAATLTHYKDFVAHIKKSCLPMLTPALGVFRHVGLRFTDRLKLWCLRKGFFLAFWLIYRNRR